jgi:ABC-type multidrug transport system fused ATPase/permease subunit
VNIQGESCYVYNQVATVDAPYKVDEYLNIKVSGDKVVGTKKGNQSGPDMTNGYTGSISGTLSSDTIKSVFSYVVEGSKNNEQEIYKITPSGLDKLRYPLIDKKGVLTPDTSKEYKTLSYKKILDSISCTIKPNTRTAIIGPTAAGKTQLMYALVGLITPSEGTVLYDDVPLSEYEKMSLYSQVGFVFQDSVLFNLSLRENIAFSTDVTDESLHKAIETAELGEFIKTLPAQLQANMQQQSAQLQTSLQGQIQQQINAVQGKLSTELKGAVQEEGKKIQQQIPSSSLPPTILPH